MVQPTGLEPATFWFVAKCSIQLSYGCINIKLKFIVKGEL